MERSYVWDWAQRRQEYELFVSQLVYDEAVRDDSEVAQDRLNALVDIPFLALDEEALGLSDAIVKAGVIPEKAYTDAGHIALAARHGMDFLLTWNCTHLANARKKQHRRRINGRLRSDTPEIITPLELLGKRYA